MFRLRVYIHNNEEDNSVLLTLQHVWGPEELDLSKRGKTGSQDWQEH